VDNVKLFDRYFFYQAREDIKNSFLLESLSKRFKTWILNRYSVKNYKTINAYLALLKTLLFSAIYGLIFLSLEVSADFLLGLTYALFFVVGGFMSLIILSLSRQAIDGIEHDHFFRVLAKNRQSLIKRVLVKRLNKGFFLWFIPLTFMPVLVTSLSGSLVMILHYPFILITFYLVLYSTIFLTQKLYFHTLRNHPIISDISLYCFSGLTLILSFGVQLLLMGLSTLVRASYEILVYIGPLIFYIGVLWLIKGLVYKHTLNYSFTHTVIMKQRAYVKSNKIQKPYKVLKLFTKKHKVLQQILMKDLLSFYRKDKREFFSLLTTSLMSVVYSGFIISALSQSEGLLSVFIGDNVLLIMIMIFTVFYLYRFKAITWVSSEDKYLTFYQTFDVDHASLYKVKVSLNQILLMPALLIYGALPFIFSLWQGELLPYTSLRLIVIVLYALVMIKYPLIRDALKIHEKRTNSFFAAQDLVVIILLIQGALLFGLVFISGQLGIESVGVYSIIGLFIVALMIENFHIRHLEKRLKRTGEISHD